MEDIYTCKKCKGDMEILREETIGRMKYYILKCKKCKQEVARHAE